MNAARFGLLAPAGKGVDGLLKTLGLPVVSRRLGASRSARMRDRIRVFLPFREPAAHPWQANSGRNDVKRKLESLELKNHMTQARKVTRAGHTDENRKDQLNGKPAELNKSFPRCFLELSGQS